MDLDKIKQVIDLMNDNKLTVFSYEEHNKYKLCLKQGGDVQTIYAAPPAGQHQAHGSAQTPPPSVNEKTIESPLVGTFYTAPSPEAPAYVKAGDKVAEGSIICIVEAMKVMNEITAEFSGTITDVLVNNAEPVEYGQELFLIE